MRVAVVTNDTRGGVQPYVALALGLREAGHDVLAVAPAGFASMFAEAGLMVAPLSGDTEAVLRRSNGAIERGAIASMRFVARELKPRIHTWTRETLDACDGVDVLTGGVGGMVVGLSVAEKLRKPFIEAHLQPIGAPTDAYPGILFPRTPRWVGRWAMRLSHYLSDRALWMPLAGAMASARKDVLGLGRRSHATLQHTALYGFSRHVLDVPADGDRPRVATGYWSRPTAPSWCPPPALESFLASGGPIVSIGFGSMTSEDPRALTGMVIDAVRRAGVRAVLVRGTGGLEDVVGVDELCCVDAVPYDWLFARVSAVVHHGGAGTTGAALQAGVPAVVVPVTMDQPFWGWRVAALGAGPSPIPRARLTSERLAHAVRTAVTDEAMRARTTSLGEKIRAEDGVAVAVEYFGRFASALPTTSNTSRCS